jgi:hypothetical protein
MDECDGNKTATEAAHHALGNASQIVVSLPLLNDPTNKDHWHACALSHVVRRDAVSDVRPTDVRYTLVFLRRAAACYSPRKP